MTIKRLGIVGSGIMGSGVAEVAARAGVEVILRSRKQETADAMVTSLGKSLDRHVEKGRLESDEREGARRLVSHGLHLRSCALEASGYRSVTCRS